MSGDNRPAAWAYTRCALNSCREQLLVDDYDQHQAERHWDRDELVGAAQDYLTLRDLILGRLNPRDDDVAEGEIMRIALLSACEFIEAQPCTCTPAGVEDYQACPRCDVLGRLGDEVQSR